VIFPEKIPCVEEKHTKKICWLYAATQDEALPETQDDILVCKECATFKEVINRAFGRRYADQTVGSTIAGLLKLVADRNARLQAASDELQNKIEELALIKTITDAVLKTTDLHKALRIILTGVTSGQAFGFNRAGIFLVDDRHEYLVGKHAVGPDSRDQAMSIWKEISSIALEKQVEQIQNAREIETEVLHKRIEKIKIRLADSSNIFIQALFGGKPRYFEKEKLDPAMEQKISVYFDFTDFVIVPLQADGPPLGLMVADNYYNNKPITPSSIDALQTLAAACTNVLEKTLLHNQLSDRLKELEHVNRLLRDNQSYLIQTERLADIGKLAATVAHEFKTPLVTIGGYARRILRKRDGDDFKKKDMDIIISEVERLEAITAEILEYSRQQKLDLKSYNLNDVVKDSLDLLDRQLSSAGIKLDADFPNGELRARLDERRFRQVVFNLVTNAVESMAYGGRLSLSTRISGGKAILEIRDTGCGIPEDHREQIFTPFFTTKSRGSGLGLPISRKIVEDHGGFMDFESRPGTGTTFSIIIPLEQDEA
jgi:signal transduction histidine kinase